MQDGTESYADLAARTVPAAFQYSLELMPSLSSEVGPDDVKPLRISLLVAREHLDVFSYAFDQVYLPAPATPSEPTTLLGKLWRAIGRLLRKLIHPLAESQQHNPDADRAGHALMMSGDAGQATDGKDWGRLDTWQALRNDLNEGYTLLGDFQVCMPHHPRWCPCEGKSGVNPSPQPVGWGGEGARPRRLRRAIERANTAEYGCYIMSLPRPFLHAAPCAVPPVPVRRPYLVVTSSPA